MADEEVLALFLTIIITVLIAATILSGVRIINPWEQGLEMRLGSFIGVLDPGFRFVVPLTTSVVRIDLRTTTQEVPAQELTMKNGVPATVDAIIYFKVVDPKRAFFEVNNYKVAVTALAQTTIRALFGDHSAVEVARDRKAFEMRLRDMLDDAVLNWGVVMEAIELRRFESGGKDLWKELAVPAPLAQLKLHAGTPLEEAATLQVMAARALLEKLRLDNREVEAFREPMENAEKALASGDHAGALRLALQVADNGLGKL